MSLGIGAGFIPGFSSENLSLVIITYGLVSSDLNLAIVAVSMEISYSFFEYLSPMIFRIGNGTTGLAVEHGAVLTEESMKRSMGIVASGGLVGILISLPVFFVAESIYPLFYSNLRPLTGWLLLFICSYMVWIERGWKKVFAATVFCLSGLLGLMIKNSGIVQPDYLLVPVFVGFYGFGSLLSKKNENVKAVEDVTLKKKTDISALAFVASMIGSLIPGMKRGQVSAIALQTWKIEKPEEVIFILPAISLALMTMSILVLSSTGNVRSTLAFDIQEVLGDIYPSQTLLLVGSLALSACLSASLLILLSKPIGKITSKINRTYFEVLGFCVCSLIVVNFSGAYGILIAATSTSISLLTTRFRIRSTHLMGVLLIPSIIASVVV